jgi:diguanylate cyclase (GGDEF)-like protein
VIDTRDTMTAIGLRLESEIDTSAIDPTERAQFVSALRHFCDTAGPALFSEDAEAATIAQAAAMQIGALYARLGLSAESIFKMFRRLRELVGEAPTETHSIEQLLESAVVAYIHQQTHTLTDRARRDSLTWLLNRSAFDLSLSDEVERARRYSRDLSLVLLDVDRFKTVNDQLGHPAGDEVLLVVAGTLRSGLRHSDLTFRYGGDEFAAICPETPGNVMHGLLERLESNLRQRFAEASLREEVGISWGVSSFPVDASDVASMIQIADQRLYACKKTHHRQHA